MKQATYFSSGKATVLSVLKENANGTVDLGNAAGELIVGSCPVAKEAKEGHCTLGEPAPEKAEKKK